MRVTGGNYYTPYAAFSVTGGFIKEYRKGEGVWQVC